MISKKNTTKNDLESQSKAILNHLKTGGVLTQLDALKKFNCMRLSARILDLRHMGYDIKTTTIKEGNKRFAEYSMEVTK